MPSTRASSNPPPSTPLRTPAMDRLAASSSRSTRASSSTPSTKGHISHHHETADEQTLREAEKILSTPTRRALRSSDTPTSARDLRHAKIVEAREGHMDGDDQDDHTSVGRRSTTPTISKKGKERARGPATSGSNAMEDEEDQVVMGQITPDRRSRAHGREKEPASVTSASTDGVPTLDGETAGSNDEDEEIGSVIVARDASDDSDKEATVHGEKDGSAGVISSEEGGTSDAVGGVSVDSTEDEDDTDESDSEDDGSDSDEDSDGDSSEGSDEEEERLEKLLQAAKISALAKDGKSGKPESTDGGEVVLQFAEQDTKQAPIPDLSIPTLPAAHLSFSKKGIAKAAPPELAIPVKSSNAKGKEKAVAPELDNRPYERQMSKREKAAQPKKASVSELWATIPAARRDALPQMKRDYQALALANSLDPKRFMKGSAKSTKVPESFAIGAMVDQPRHLQDTTLSREARYRPGQVVQNLARDEDMNATAKRKYGDLQWKRMENGRGKGWKKRSKW